MPHLTTQHQIPLSLQDLYNLLLKRPSSGEKNPEKSNLPEITSALSVDTPSQCIDSFIREMNHIDSRGIALQSASIIRVRSVRFQGLSGEEKRDRETETHTQRKRERRELRAARTCNKRVGKHTHTYIQRDEYIGKPRYVFRYPRA